MKPIGGYFELELEKGKNVYHKGAMGLKSGRSSLLFILNHVKPSCVYIPYYTCDGLLEPFFLSNVEFRFYGINHKLEPVNLPVLKSSEYLLYINYFDLKRKYVEELSGLLGGKLIVDCTQAFFQKGNGKSWFFNSCRKYFGTPDGSYLYAPSNVVLSADLPRNEKFTVDHLVRRFNGHAERGYNSFLQNENLCDAELSSMSKLSEYLLSTINYDSVIQKRRANYYYLQSVFSDKCILKENDEDAVPMVFPALGNRQVNRRILGSDNIFIPTFWHDVLKRDYNGFDFEKRLTIRLLPLPVDHRYTLSDMTTLETKIKSII